MRIEQFPSDREIAFWRIVSAGTLVVFGAMGAIVAIDLVRGQQPERAVVLLGILSGVALVLSTSIRQLFSRRNRLRIVLSRDEIQAPDHTSMFGGVLSIRLDEVARAERVNEGTVRMCLAGGATVDVFIGFLRTRLRKALVRALKESLGERLVR